MIENPILKYLLIFVASMVPLFELRFTMLTLVPTLDVNLVLAFIIGVIGNMLPVPIIYLFARRVLEWGKDKKVIVFKYKAKKNERKKQGHRQQYTKVQIEDIVK